MQKGNKGPNHERNRKVEPRRVSTSGKRRNAQEGRIWDFQWEDHETCSRNFQWVTENEETGLVEVSAPRSGKRSSISARRAGYGEAPATPGVMAPTGEREKETGRTLDDGDTSGSPGTLAVNRSGRAGLKEGANVEVGEWPPSQRKRRRCKHSPRKKRNGDAPLGYSWRTALKREQCNVDGHSVVR
jgi:hypothetical protein